MVSNQQRSPSRMRIFNKHVINRITRRFASFSLGPFAVIRHVGRRSGKPYETPILIEPMGDDFVIALTYGESVDWYRNILAVGHCSMLWNGRTYSLGKPEPMTVRAALPVFPPFLRRVLRILGTQHFVYLKSQGGEASTGKQRERFASVGVPKLYADRTHLVWLPPENPLSRC